jgi:hypothetical protein
MGKWLDRATREFLERPGRDTANRAERCSENLERPGWSTAVTAERNPTALLAVPYPALSEKKDDSALAENTTPRLPTKPSKPTSVGFEGTGTLVYGAALVAEPAAPIPDDVDEIVAVWRRVLGFSASREHIAENLRQIRDWQNPPRYQLDGGKVRQ